MPRSKQSREEKLRKKRLAEKLRMQKIKNDPDLKAQWQVKERENYLKKKQTGKIIPVSQMTPKQQKIARKKSRESSNRHNRKKKMAKLALNEEQPMILLDEDTDANTNCDPLEMSPISSVAISESVTNPPVMLSPSPTCSGINTPKRLTRSTFKQQNFSIHQEEEKDGVEIINPLKEKNNENDQIQQELPFSDNISIDSPIPESTSSRSISNVSSPCRSPIIQKPLINQSTKKKSPWKHLLRTIRYRSNKELKIRDRKIMELKALNEKYKKQLKRLQRDKKEQNRIRDNYSKPKIEKNHDREDKENFLIKSSKGNINKIIENFFEEDDNSRLCPGKREYITRHKIRKQKRYLTDTLQNLHKKFLQNHSHLKMSYSCFCKLRPFWTVVPNLNVRETCLCKEHENMDLAVIALKRNGLIDEKSAFEVLKSLCCDPRNVDCLSNKCNLCKNKNLNFKEFDNSKETYYWMWKKNKKTYTKNGQEKQTMQTMKEKVVARPKEIIEYFENLIIPYRNHCANIVSQSNYIKNLKKTLKPEECIVHCDFSENYNTKYASEIQSFHFGSSRQQITLHTVVIYYMKDGVLTTQCLCTVSESLRHDAVAVWEHLLPVLKFIEDNIPEVDSLYFISDSPSGQYRNRKMFYVMAKLNWHYVSLRRVVWNYTEAGHGKGAPDGVGGVLKRTADQIVARGNDIQNLESLVSHLSKNVTNVILKVVNESGIFEKDLMIPAELKEFRGTMNVHQVIWNSNNRNVLAMRRLSCGLERCSLESLECTHGQHIGFFNIESPHSGNINQANKTSSKRVPKTKNNSLIKQTRQIANNKDESRNQLDFGDSFWTDVPSIDERVITPTLAEAVINSLQVQEKNCRPDNTDDVAIGLEIDDLNIFD